MTDPWEAQREALGAFIREQRKRANLSLRQLAELTSLSNPYLSQVERGLHQPSVRVLKAISGALNVSAETLMTQAGLIDAIAGDAAEATCRSSSAVVTGPTPPGTGLSAPATSATAGSTSPASPPSAVALVPTSTTTAPPATNPRPTSPARPVATTSTSAVDVTAARSTVREWHTVTVASRASSSCATGLPTTAERPTT